MKKKSIQTTCHKSCLIWYSVYHMYQELHCSWNCVVCIWVCDVDFIIIPIILQGYLTDTGTISLITTDYRELIALLLLEKLTPIKCFLTHCGLVIPHFGQHCLQAMNDKSLAHCHIITWNNINYWGLNDYCQLNPEGYIPMKFYLKFKSFHSLGFGNVICRVATVFCSDLRGLTHCGLVKPYGNIDLDQAIWQYRAGSTLDWSNDFVPDSIKPLPELTLTSSVKSTDNQLRAISQDNSAINYYNHKAITWANVDALSVWSCTIHLRAISQKIP